jgi:hypothetical protein
MENNSAHKSLLYDLLRTVVCAIPVKVWVSLLFGIPTSIYGVYWMEYKTAKQDSNCYSDLNHGLARSVTTDPYQYADQLDEKLKDYLSCMQGVDPKIGSVKFVREEINRL